MSAAPPRRDSDLAAFASELARWGARMNLVGSTDPAAIARHVEDALAAVPFIPEGVSVVDLGSGAGFPGLPIAIARRDLRVCLVEVREKRVAFLRHVARSLSLEVDVRRQSFENAPPQGFDVVALRAVAAPKQSLEIARQWVSTQGEILIWAGPGIFLPGAQAIPLASGGSILRVRAVEFSRGTD